MPTWTKWTPELIAARLTAAHEYWLLDTETGKKTGQPFNPAYLVRIGQRQVHAQNRGDGLFDAGLKFAPMCVRVSWRARGHRDWTRKSSVRRLKELFQLWYAEPAGRPWCLSYLLFRDPSFVRCAPRNGIDIEGLVKRIGGEVRILWRAKRRVVRKPPVRRTVPTAAKALTAAYDRWQTDGTYGLPAGRAFGPHYLRQIGEERLEAWLRRNKKSGRTDKVLARLPVAARKAWLRKRHP